LALHIIFQIVLNNTFVSNYARSKPLQVKICCQQLHFKKSRNNFKFHFFDPGKNLFKVKSLNLLNAETKKEITILLEIFVKNSEQLVYSTRYIKKYL